jgi:hypothetical protein
MAETMSHVERVLWRIAELGARCSQQTAAGGRGPLWAELEQTIAELQADFEAARQATDIAPAQVRSLEGRLKVALRERDREKARIQEFAADAQAARRERDRERQKARKVMAAAVQARDAAAAAKASEARAVAARDQAVAALDDAIATGERAADARDAAARAESAVVVLPGVAMPDAEAAPVAPARRVSWQPTWSEWADPETVGATDTANAADAAATDEIVLDDSCTGEEGAVRYLNVAATIAQLLPEDLGPFLVDGATVVRREGRLFATLAVATGDWAAPGAAGAQQVQRFADAGFKVEWASNAPLGV